MSRRFATVILGMALVASGCVGRTGGPGVAAASDVASASMTASESAPASTAPTSPSPVTAAASSAPSEPPATSPPRAEPKPTARPTPTPAPRPSVAIGIENGLGGTQIQVTPGGTVDIRLILRTTDLDQRQCSVVHSVTPDSPKIAASEEPLPPVDVQTVALVDGLHGFNASCPSVAGTLTTDTGILAVDGAPERCEGWEFPEDPVSISTIDELRAGMVGSWHGCVDTPWVPTYWIDLTFRADGTYSSAIGEVLDGFSGPGLYYGTDADDPDKRWRIDDLQASGLGVGIIDIVFGGDSVNRDPVSAIRLMGDSLQFEIMHHGTYGPLVLQLVRD